MYYICLDFPVYYLSIDTTIDDVSCGLGLFIGLKVSIPLNSKSTKGVGYKTPSNFWNDLLLEGKHLKIYVKLNKLSVPHGGNRPLPLGEGGGAGEGLLTGEGLLIPAKETTFRNWIYIKGALLKQTPRY